MWHHLSGSAGDEITYFRYFSPYGKYIGVTTSTPVPRVGSSSRSLCTTSFDWVRIIVFGLVLHVSFSFLLQVNQYMVFTVRTNVFVEKIHYLVR